MSVANDRPSGAVSFERSGRPSEHSERPPENRSERLRAGDGSDAVVRHVDKFLKR